MTKKYKFLWIDANDITHDERFITSYERSKFITSIEESNNFYGGICYVKTGNGWIFQCLIGI
jgi:hypothetical protein